MGVASKEVAFLAAIRGLGVKFDRTLTIGRQSLLADAAGIHRGSIEGGGPISVRRATGLLDEGAGYVEPFLRYLGAHEAHSIDASNYEGSTFVHDMNDPLPPELEERYSLVFDGGSLEHIFNVSQALTNCMSAVEIGGHLATVTSCNNLVGHGFYQFSPEVFYRAFTPENGFEVRVILIRALHKWGRWRQAQDPTVVRGRVEMTNSWPTLIYVLARKAGVMPAFSTWPQQSDYVTEWAGEPRQRRRRLAERLPAPARQAARVASAFVGTSSGPDHFRSVELDKLNVR